MCVDEFMHEKKEPIDQRMSTYIHRKGETHEDWETDSDILRKCKFECSIDKLLDFELITVSIFLLRVQE